MTLYSLLNAISKSVGLKIGSHQLKYFGSRKRRLFDKQHFFVRDDAEYANKTYSFKVERKTRRLLRIKSHFNVNTDCKAKATSVSSKHSTFDKTQPIW